MAELLWGHISVVIAEYALRNIQKPIGVSEYQLTRAIPESLKTDLPTVEEIEAELNEIENSNKDSENNREIL